eukprot:11929717-Alexandrium_andersonii.AAC.1
MALRWRHTRVAESGLAGTSADCEMFTQGCSVLKWLQCPLRLEVQEPGLVRSAKGEWRAVACSQKLL